MSNFKVILLGTRVITQTWDHALEVDGKGDEIYVNAEVRLINSSGDILFGTPRLSKTMGDINGFGSRVKAGSLSSKGGIKTGDDIPYRNPFNQQSPEKPDEFPMKIFEGEITEDQGLVIVPSIWEWDGGKDLFNSWGSHVVRFTGDIVRSTVNILNAVKGGSVPTEAQLKLADFLKSEIDSGLKALFSFLTNITGQAMDRPIGMKKSGDQATYSPKVIMLPLKIAEMVASKDFGLGKGIFEIFYEDDPGIGGAKYTLYVKLEKVGGSTTPPSGPPAEWIAPWVRSLYKDLLGRPAENEHVVQSRVEALHSGRITIRGIINGFLTSLEYGQHYANYLYCHFLDRNPESDQARVGRAREVMNGVPYQLLTIGFVDSPEFKQRHAVPEEFVKFLYKKILLREPDQGGFNHHVAEINSGRTTTNAIRIFLGSEEYGNLMSNEYFVRFLRRSHTPGPQSPFTRKIMNGAPLQEVMIDILGSQEYIQGSLARNHQNLSEFISSLAKEVKSNSFL